MVKENKKATINEFARYISEISKTDRWVLIVCSGEMGEGKSCFSDQLLTQVARYNGLPFSYEGNMTYSRKELKTWIDGDEKGNNRLPERSCILSDELISLFFKRNWYDAEQIDGIELLNKSRDRHLVIVGNIPQFQDLDKAFLSIVTYRIHIFERGIAWVWEKDRNPWIEDLWHTKINAKRFAKYKNPYKDNGFLFEIRFDNWSPEQKAKYYAVRNVKRLNTEGQRAKEERYREIKDQRNLLIRWIFELDPTITDRAVAEAVGISPQLTGLIRNNVQ